MQFNKLLSSSPLKYKRRQEKKRSFIDNGIVELVARLLHQIC